MDGRRQRRGDKWCNTQKQTDIWTEEDKGGEINGVIHKQTDRTDIWTKKTKAGR